MDCIYLLVSCIFEMLSCWQKYLYKQRDRHIRIHIKYSKLPMWKSLLQLVSPGQQFAMITHRHRTRCQRHWPQQLCYGKWQRYSDFVARNHIALHPVNNRTAGCQYQRGMLCSVHLEICELIFGRVLQSWLSVQFQDSVFNDLLNMSYTVTISFAI